MKKQPLVSKLHPLPALRTKLRTVVASSFAGLAPYVILGQHPHVILGQHPHVILGLVPGISRSISNNKSILL